MSDRPFADLIRPTPGGGVVITIDHPAGPLEWQLPGDRALEFIDALISALPRPESPVLDGLSSGDHDRVQNMSDMIKARGRLIEAAFAALTTDSVRR